MGASYKKELSSERTIRTHSWRTITTKIGQWKQNAINTYTSGQSKNKNKVHSQSKQSTHTGA